jgi:hypothetical protein
MHYKVWDRVVVYKPSVYEYPYWTDEMDFMDWNDFVVSSGAFSDDVVMIKWYYVLEKRLTPFNEDADIYDLIG